MKPTGSIARALDTFLHSLGQKQTSERSSMHRFRRPLVRWISRGEAVFELGVNVSHFPSLRWDASKDQQ